jgi:hypothetical protein
MILKSIKDDLIRGCEMQEFLVLVVIALVIFYLPRMLGRGPATGPPVHLHVRMPPLTGRMRLAIVVTVCWIAGSAALLEPWQREALPFLTFGLAPPTILWGCVWVWHGYRKYRR